MAYNNIFFSKRKFATAKQMRFSANAKGVKNSPVMKKILRNKNVAKVLDKHAEKMELYESLKEKASGGVTKNELREVLGKFRSGQGKTIDKHEAMQLAKEIGPKFGKRYIFKKEIAKAPTAGISNPSSTRSDLINAFGRKNIQGNKPASPDNAQKYTRSFSRSSQTNTSNNNPGNASGSGAKSKLFG